MNYQSTSTETTGFSAPAACDRMANRTLALHARTTGAHVRLRLELARLAHVT